MHLSTLNDRALPLSATQANPGWAILTLAFAAFVIVTTEFIIVGLIPELARDLDISVSVAGQLVTMFSLAILVAGPPMSLWLSRFERRKLFVCILVVFFACNAASAISQDYWSLMLSRIAPALLVPVFWGIGSDAAGQIAGPEKTGSAVSQVYFGVTAALLFGVPLGTVFGGLVGWRGSFWILSALSLVAAILIALFMPRVEQGERVNPLRQLQSLRSRYFIANILLSVAVYTSMFIAYTYLADMLEQTVGVQAPMVGWWLMAFGAVGLLGNFLAGAIVDKRPTFAGVLFSALLAIGVSSSVAFVDIFFGLVVSLAIWGIAHTALFPLCQVRVMSAAEDGKALAATFNISASNGGIALGAVLGGWTISNASMAAAMISASVLSAACAVALPFVERLRPASSG